jgi:hypothetical protein
MRFALQSLWSGGVVVGGVISFAGFGQWVYETTAKTPFEIHIEWHLLVIIGLVIVIISSLSKAHSLYKAGIQQTKDDGEQERIKLNDKILQLARLPVESDDRSMSDVYPEIPSNKNGIFFKVGSISVGVIKIQNDSVEPVDVEIQYEILGGNIPILLQNRVDTIPFYRDKHIYRSVTINPKGKTDGGFVAFALVDRFHKGFKFPSYLASNDKKLKYRIEGRVSMFNIGRGKIGEFPYLDVRLRVIAMSAVNISKVHDDVFIYRVKANPVTSELTLESLDVEKVI